jgi:dihydroorotate dehydrogenase electron transfer subunit
MRGCRTKQIAGNSDRFRWTTDFTVTSNWFDDPHSDRQLSVGSDLTKRLRMIDVIATTIDNQELAPGYRLLTLDFAREISVSAGQFAMVKAHGVCEPLLRRALAIYRVSGPHQLSFLYQVLGRGTEALSKLQPGSPVDCLVPLGNSWLGEPFGLPRRAIVVAGGIGSASVLMLCRELRDAGIDTRLFFGAVSERSAIGCGLNDFRMLELPLTVTTDDGTLAEQGLVTEPLERAMRGGDVEDATVYSCGPWVMMKRVAEMSRQYRVACNVSLEAPMGCGFGVCVGCVVAVNTEAEPGYDSYRRVCVDGSIFSANDIRWEVNAMSH